MKYRIFTFGASLVLLSSIFFNSNITAQSFGYNDSGYFLAGPRKEIKTKKIKPDVFITAFTSDGVIITDNSASPWFNATLFVHGSVLTDSAGKELKEVLIFEACDKDGDLNWSLLHYPEGNKGPGIFELVQGTGKWAGIKGNGKIIGNSDRRVDDYISPGYEIRWDIDPVNAPNSNQIPGKENYKYSDQCLSFHGPHIFLLRKELSNGISLEFSTQSGVLMSMLGPDTSSPRNNATCYDRGNTVKLDGKTLGDIMLLEDTDHDGDVVWLLHIWWYNKGPGSYKFIDGIGKWEGINGVGVTRGMYKNRTDDHFMLKSELVWNLMK